MVSLVGRPVRDTVSTISNTVFSNKDDWGSSSFDVRQSVSGALHFDIPSATRDKLLSVLTRDWSIDSVVVARTGFPFNAVLLTLGTVGGVYPRPDLVPENPSDSDFRCSRRKGPESCGFRSASSPHAGRRRTE